MAWRLARSLEVLRAEIKAIYPNATIYTIGDPAHQARSSDHNPNSAGVVCAIDIMGTGGVDMAALSELIRARRHPAGKYLIYNRRITRAREGWVWQAFSGDPHTDHIHLSVGVGPDGQSTGDYDNTDPWLTGGDMFCKKGDRNENVRLLQLNLNEVAAGLRPDLKALSVDSSYGDSTAARVYTLLTGPDDGANFNATLADRLAKKLFQVRLMAALKDGVIPVGRDGEDGVDGTDGKDAVLAPGTVLVVQAMPAE
jgi:hypothetical protein